MQRKLRTVLVAASVAAAIGLPIHLLADLASCSVNAASFADSVLNPSRGEDTEFFVSTGGVPNIMLVLDTSGSMRRLPPDGASQSWGSFEAPTTGYGCNNTKTFAYFSPCGLTTLEGAAYTATSNWATDPKDASGQYCPYMVAGNQAPATDKPGFDPDFYNAGSNPWFFERNKVYHDVIWSPDPTADGWSDWSTSPAGSGGAAYATWADFCNKYAGDATKVDTCNACLRDKGYFFDGTYRTIIGTPISCASTDDCKAKNAGTCVSDGTGREYTGDAADTGTKRCRLPDVWFAGNFLNFYPPKFVVARKVLKDVLQSVRKIRLGLTTFSLEKSGNDVVSGNGGSLLRSLNPGCNMLGSPSQFDSNRTAVKNQINNPFFTSGGDKYSFYGSTPLAETLLNVGQLYASVLNPVWFNDDYDRTDFHDAAATSNGKSICFSCQASAVLLITDGVPTADGHIPGQDFATRPMTTAVANQAGSYAGMPGYNITDISSVDCPVCNTQYEAADTSIAAGNCTGQQATGACDDAGNPIQSYLPKVAWYLKNLDLRPDAEKGADGMPLTKKQTITTYTIGLHTDSDGAASKILEHTAEAGGGLFNGGLGGGVSDAKTLKDAILKVFEDVNTRSTSFGAASLSTLQIAASQGVLIPRFEPSRNAHWDGHLYSFDLYSEFVGGCTTADVSVSGPANGDYDCDGKCASVFLRDADGDFIQEDGNGAFKKNLDPKKAACGYGSRCSAAKCAGPNPSAPAKPFWDAGSKLAPVKTTIDAVSGLPIDSENPDFAKTRLEWDQRKIYTAVDRNADGKIDSSDTLAPATSRAVVELTTANAATLVPYLNIKGTRFCEQLAARLSTKGDDVRATAIRTQAAAGTYTACAEVIIAYTRGADVFNERGSSACTTFPTTWCTRRYQLGDVFHSSPVEVWGTSLFSSEGFYCPTDLHNQCLHSAFSPSIPNPSSATPRNSNAWDDYTKSDRYAKRKKFVLVGANDGMLHAFRFERSDSQAGEEIWGFVPPDLLPKLRMLTENIHQFYVDGTPMVREVWLDGVANENAALGSATLDGRRQGREFHTVAVVGERRGGNRYFALDVTEVLAYGETDHSPKFLWMYPQPNDPESLAFGETYVDFLPKPPPMGPVKLDRGATPCIGNYPADPDGSGRCFEERWIVFLSGGFDPQYTRGRGVHMVDLATGNELFDFSQPSGPASQCDATKDPRCHLNYPVAATVGMMMWGNQPSFSLSAATNGYFDTATFGDTGGQLWTLRFNKPGIQDASGRVTNWFGGRALQHGLNATTPACGLGYCDGQPFFYITSNVPIEAGGNLYRTFAGTGDRFNILDPVGGTCGPDNIRACMLKGCTVTIRDGAGNAGAVYGVEPVLGKQGYSALHPASCTGVDPATYKLDVTAGVSGGACTTVTSRVDGITITCPNTTTCSGQAESTKKSAALVCTADACEPSAKNEFGIPINTRGNADKRNWFFSVLVFETTGSRQIFNSLDGAKTYDGARLNEDDLTNVNPVDTSNVVANLASPTGRGWSYFFDHGERAGGAAVTIPIAGVDHNIYRTDERTAATTTIAYGCIFWNTLQTGIPVGAYDATTDCPIDSPCKAGRAQVSYAYAANVATGGLCLRDAANALVRTQRQETLVPPNIGKMVAYVGQGQVSFGLTSVRVPQGGANVQLGEPVDIASGTQWLPVDHGLHECRHAKKETQPGYTGPPANALCR